MANTSKRVRIVLEVEVPAGEKLDEIYVEVKGRRTLFGHGDVTFDTLIDDELVSIEEVPPKGSKDG